MLRALLTQSFRNLLRNKVFSAINIVGLSTAMVVCILIGQYVRFELSYDKFNPNSENIFRVSTQVRLQNKVIHNEANTYQGIADALKQDFPDVTASTSIAGFDSDNTFVRYLDEKNELRPIDKFHGFFVDSAFFRIFSFPLAAGNEKVAFNEPHAALVSESWAKKYLNPAPVGRILELNDGEAVTQYKITGILKDVPANSHLKFDLLLHDHRGTYDEKKDFWMWGGHTYIAAQPGASIASLQRKLDNLAQSKMGLKITKDDYGQTSSFVLQPLRNIHLYSHLEEELEEGGSAAIVYALITLAFLIISIAWVNYINLATSMSFAKVKSVAIRKIVGGTRVGSMIQILTESAVFNVISLTIAIAAAMLLLPAFIEFVNIPSGISAISDWRIYISLLAFYLLSTVISGVYPALVISSHSPSKTLKGLGDLQNGLWLRKTLVTFQFAMTIVVTIAMVISKGQLSFMHTKELGINVNNILVVKALNFNKEIWSNEKDGYVVDPVYEQRSTVFKDEIKTQMGIEDATSLSHVPGGSPNWGTEFRMESIDERKAFRLHAIGVDYDFIKTLGLRVLAGRSFSPVSPSDRGDEKQRSIIINETASKLIGFKSPDEAINKHITTFWGANYKIIGVLNSFHWLSPKDELEPVYLILQPRALTYFAIKFGGNNIKSTLDNVHTMWNRHFPELPFNYFFLDQYFERQYDQDRKLSSIVIILTGLLLLIAGLGLFGLTSHAIVRRTREIGIRKVLGATVTNVIGLFTDELAKLILVASILTLPVSYWGASLWLEKYAFRISLQWWHFAMPVLFVLLVACAATIVQTLGIAFRNPTESLRNE